MSDKVKTTQEYIYALDIVLSFQEAPPHISKTARDLARGDR